MVCIIQVKFFQEIKAKMNISMTTTKKQSSVLPIFPYSRSIVYNPSDGANPGTPAAPLTEPFILSGSNQIHLASILRVLIEEPVPLSNIAREDIVNVEAIL